MPSRTVITIDGLAASGKSTLARELAKKLGFAYLPSGLLYRAVAYLALQHNVSAADESSIVALLSQHQLQLIQKAEDALVLIDGADCSDQLQGAQVTEITSQIAVLGKLRAALSSLQREAFGCSPLVAEGRDMGTVIFPDAQLKFFVTAALRTRAERRASQQAAVIEEVERALLERDRRDQVRELSPTVAAQDAVLVDNSGQPLTAVLDGMYHLALRRGLGPTKPG
jgi:cytidylate kinase